MAKKEWELEHLQAKKEAEERKNAAEEDDMFFTYAKDDSYDQVHSPKSSSKNTSVNKLKMRISRVIPNGNGACLSPDIVENDFVSSKRNDEYVDVIDDERPQGSPVDFRPNRRLSRRDSDLRDGVPNKNVWTSNRHDRLSRQSSRSNSRSSSRSSSKSRINPSNSSSPVHSPRCSRRSSKT